MRSACLAALLCLAAPSGLAALSDEIQVYDDSINKPGEFGLEVHVNRTPVGRSRPDYPGEITPGRGLRVTPELSYVLTPSFDIGLYTPLLFEGFGQSYYAGPKFRAKWLPVRAGDGGGAFLGINWELATVRKSFDEARNSMEFRPIIGYRTPGWLAVVNPVMGYELTKGHREGGLDFSPAIKLSKAIGQGFSGGIEYYSELGKLAHLNPGKEQAHTLYLAFDLDRGPIPLNFGIGRGLNSATDKWTIKAVLDIPLGK